MASMEPRLCKVDGKNWAVIGTDLCVHHTPKKVVFVPSSDPLIAPTPAELAAADDLTTAMVDEVIAEAERAKDEEQ